MDTKCNSPWLYGLSMLEAGSNWPWFPFKNLSPSDGVNCPQTLPSAINTIFGLWWAVTFPHEKTSVRPLFLWSNLYIHWEPIGFCWCFRALTKEVAASIVDQVPIRVHGVIILTLVVCLNNCIHLSSKWVRIVQTLSNLYIPVVSKRFLSTEDKFLALNIPHSDAPLRTDHIHTTSCRNRTD